MAFPVIVFNTSTGSDTVASGAGPSVAITGTAAAHTGGTASVTVTLTNSPDLSGIAVDGSHAVRLTTASGRQWSKITGKDNSLKTLTVEDSFNIASGSAVDYAIGGKLATWDHANSRVLFISDVKAGWTLETETDQSLTSSINSLVSGDNTNGFVSVRGSSEHKVITQTINTRHFDSSSTGIPSNWFMENLHFKNSAGSKTGATAIESNSGTYVCRRCIFGDQTHSLLRGMTRGGNIPVFVAIDCEFKYCSIAISAVPGETTLLNCWIHHCSNDGIRISPSTNSPVTIQGCVINNNSGNGIAIITGTLIRTALINNNVIDNNGGDGIKCEANFSRYFIHSNHITNNGGYGIRAFAAGQERLQHLIDYNNFYNNGSGPRLNLNAGANDLASDPQYRDAAGGDFSAGPSFRSIGFPGVTRTLGGNQSATKIYNDIGLLQQPGDGMAARTLFLGTGQTCG